MAWWDVNTYPVFIPTLNTHEHIRKDAVVPTHNEVWHHQFAELNQVIIGGFVRGSRVQLVDHLVDLKHFFSAKRVQISEHHFNVGFCEVG
jgi:hypothetical protein